MKEIISENSIIKYFADSPEEALKKHLIFLNLKKKVTGEIKQHSNGFSLETSDGDVFYCKNN